MAEESQQGRRKKTDSRDMKTERCIPSVFWKECCLALLHFSVISLLFMLHSFIIFTQDAVNSVFLLIHQCYFREDNSQFLVSMPHSFTIWGNCSKSFSVNKLKGMSRETNAQVPFPSKGSLALSLPSLHSYHTSTLSVVWLTNQSLR